MVHGRSTIDYSGNRKMGNAICTQRTWTTNLLKQKTPPFRGEVLVESVKLKDYGETTVTVGGVVAATTMVNVLSFTAMKLAV